MVRQAQLLTLAGIRARYRSTLAGITWVILNPVLRFLGQWIAFDWLLHFAIPGYAQYLASGLLPWFFLQQAMEMSVGQFIEQARLVRILRTNPMVYVIAVVGECFLIFLFSFFLLELCLSAAYSDDRIQAITRLASLPLTLIPLAVGTAALCISAATLQVFFRDTRFILSFALQILYFLTPIFYTLDMVTPNLQPFLLLNPVLHLIRPIQSVVEQGWSQELAPILFAAYGTALTLLAACCALWSMLGQRVRSYV